MNRLGIALLLEPQVQKHNCQINHSLLLLQMPGSPYVHNFCWIQQDSIELKRMYKEPDVLITEIQFLKNTNIDFRIIFSARCTFPLQYFEGIILFITSRSDFLSPSTIPLHNPPLSPSNLISPCNCRRCNTFLFCTFPSLHQQT